MKIDMVVSRHESPGVPHFLTRCVDAAIINAGDGAHEHPTQALLDLFTMQQIYPDLEGQENCDNRGHLPQPGGALEPDRPDQSWEPKVVVCGPKSLMPHFLAALWAQRYRTILEETLAWCDIAMALRIQMERIGGAYRP